VAAEKSTSAATPKAITPAKTGSAPATSKAPTAPPAAKLSDAEKIAGLRNSLDEDQKSLKKLQDQYSNPASEYEQAQKAFQEVDRQVVDKNREIQKLKEQKKDAEIEPLTAQLKSLEKPRQLAKDRFELAIKDRKSLQLKTITLEQKIARDKGALDKLTGEATTAGKPPATVNLAAGKAPPAAPTDTKAGATPRSAPPTSPAAAMLAASSQPAPKAAEPPKSAKNLKLEQARKEAVAKLEAAQEAAADEETLTARIEATMKTIELERDTLATARQKCENASDTESDLILRLNRRMSEGASREEISGYWQQVGEARKRFQQAQDDVTEQTSKIDELQSQMSALQSEMMFKRDTSEQKRREADAQQKELAHLENPFALHNVLHWLIEHGPNLIFIVIGIYVLGWCMRLVSRRMFTLLVRGPVHGQHTDPQARASTLTSVFENASSILIKVGGFLMICEEIGVDVKVLLGSVGVVGLAVAFGAQNLIKDYFTGFMILLENQYAVNDVVTIGSISGQVEQVTLRLTVLRDNDGRVHFIPNGQISTVTNKTLGWTRAVFEIGIAYKENVDQSIQVLHELTTELYNDPKFGPMIIEPASMPGVEQLGDSAVILKFHIKTKPLQQSDVKREMLRRIKNRFDELKIDIPFPHRTLYLVHSAAENEQKTPLGLGDASQRPKLSA
jgi:small conductance mechanosensitive channel